MKTLSLALVLFASVAQAQTFAEVNSMATAQAAQAQQSSNLLGFAGLECSRWVEGSPQFEAAFADVEKHAADSAKYTMASNSCSYVTSDGIETPDDETADLNARIDYHFAMFLYYWANGAHDTYSVFDANNTPVEYWVYKANTHAFAASVLDVLR